MPKGGPLAFLNKKHWHPGRLQNQEKVWKKEQEAAKEQQKLEDLRKQIEEERAKEELNAMAAAAGVKVYVHRIWIMLSDMFIPHVLYLHAYDAGGKRSWIGCTRVV